MKSAPPEISPRSRSSRGQTRGFPIVGLGASAGGLEALSQFLAHVPAGSGMAFVVVQHLDPTQKGMMPELLQHATAMQVVQVKDRTRVRPECVYVIPPDRDLSLLHGVLHLLAPAGSRGLRLPIDFFFRSLAEDQRERSVGIVLSGMGSDGTQGLKAIKDHAGVALVQEPSSAKFDAMPRHAIEAGLADFIAPATELPGKLIAYRHHRARIAASGPQLDETTRSGLEKIVILLRARTGHDFSLYRRNTLSRRVERRMGLHQLPRIAAYVRFLRENPQELDILFKELLIGVTGFFRDPAAWRKLAKLALPALLTHRPAGGTLRAWVAGCSTGEEAYTLAMIFAEATSTGKSAGRPALQIYATDLDRDAIDRARLGVYPESIAADVSPARLARFFVKTAGGYRVSKEIRSRVVFAPQNLIMDPPFTKLDLLCCRNLLIYLTPELQKKLFPLFHYSLNPGGVLFLGSAESLGGFAGLFSPIAAQERIFRRKETARRGELLDFPAVFQPAGNARTAAPALPRPPASLQAVADGFMQAHFAPPAVLVNDQGDILYISGRTGPYLEPAAGKANWNVLAMAREGLRYDLATALQKVRRQKSPIKLPGLALATGSVDLLVQKLTEPPEIDGLVLIVFSDTPAAAGAPDDRGSRKTDATARQRTLERALQRARAEVAAVLAEKQSSQEELRSTNEELQSTNEELQSTNEELTTSKEEMQSLNEELQTVNAELQAKLDELSAANNDMKNLLNSTDIATVFLDRDLRVRRFTQQAKTIIKLIPGDVGRPVTDLASSLLYPGLVADARTVLRTLVFVERTVAAAGDRWFTVRVMPYRTVDDRIDGVVMTFADITAAKAVEAGLREQHSELARHAARQGRALGRAKERLQASGRSPAAPPKKPLPA